MGKKIFRSVQKTLLVKYMTDTGAARVRLGVLIGFAAIMIAASPGHAIQGIEEAAASISSPEDVASFFAQEFTYEMTFPDRAHSPEEIMESRTGDCEDFAILASAMLTRMGVENQVVVIKFAGLRVAHAICIWRNRGGTYDFISSQEFYLSGQKTVEAAIKKFYPDCSATAVIDPRTYAARRGSGMAGAKSYVGAGLMADLDPRRLVDL